MSYHDEQESIESLKAWWTQWGNAATWIVLVALVAAAGWNGWNFWQRRQAAEAAVLYDQVQQAVASGDKAKVTRVATDMEDRFSRTAYAQMTALSAAKALYGAGDEAGAKAQLQWTIDHAKDDEFKQIAKLRMASLLLDDKAYDQVSPCSPNRNPTRSRASWRMPAATCLPPRASATMRAVLISSRSIRCRKTIARHVS